MYFRRWKSSPCPLTLSPVLSASSLGGHKRNQLGIKFVSASESLRNKWARDSKRHVMPMYDNHLVSLCAYFNFQTHLTLGNQVTS